MTDAERMTVEKPKRYEHLFVLIQDPNIPMDVNEKAFLAFGYLHRDAQLKDVIEKADVLQRRLAFLTYENVTPAVFNAIAIESREYDEAKKKAGV